MYNHNKAQQSKNRVHISWDILYLQHTHTADYILEEYIIFLKLAWILVILNTFNSSRPSPGTMLTLKLVAIFFS